MKKWVTKKGSEIIRVLAERSNVFLLKKDNLNILIDTSVRNERRKLINRLCRLNINRLDYLVLTHTHYDHVQNAAFIQRKYSAKIIVHASEAHFLNNGYTPLPKGTIFPTKALIKLTKFFGIKKRYEPCCADIRVDEKFDITQTGDVFVLHTPGHTRGSVSLIVDNEIAIVGDAMMATYPNSIFIPFADDVLQVIESWGKLLQTNCVVFLPGHGGENRRELVTRIFEKRKGKA